MRAATLRSLIASRLRRPVLFVACSILSSAAAVTAQQPVAPPAQPEFFSRYDFHLTAEALANDDIRFRWDTYWGGDFDFVDYVVGRTSILVDYEAVLGNEIRPFDANQAYYVLEASSSARVGATEIAGVFHHVSRHLSDRPKRFAIAWNVLGARVMRRFTRSGTSIDLRADAGRVTQRAWVDYAWIGDLDLLIRRQVSSRVGVYARGYGETFGIQSVPSGRGRQSGGRLEGGVRLSGAGGALELFAGYERRIDADPVDRMPIRWGFAGFRLVSK